MYGGGMARKIEKIPAKARAKKPAIETKADHQKRIVEIVCGVISETTLGIRRICDGLRDKDKRFPAARTIRSWIDENPEFAALYARAKQIQLHNLADQIIEISDDDSQDEIFTDEGKRLLNAEFVQRSKLRVDSRKWLLSKLMPKVYGDRIEHAGEMTIKTKELPASVEEFV
jgi:hypothetical protein